MAARLELTDSVTDMMFKMSEREKKTMSATHYIPQANWHMALADAIEQSKDGDIIVVHNLSMKELAERAHGRMCPGKNIVFQIEEKS